MILSFLNFYLVANLLILIVSLAFTAWRKLAPKMDSRPVRATELKLHYFLLVSCLALAIFRSSGAASSATGWAHIEAASVMHGSEPFPTNPATSGVVETSVRRASLPATTLFNAILSLVATVLGAGLIRSLIEIRRMHRALGGALPLRRMGRLTIAISEKVPVAFSLRLGRAWVVVPATYVTDPRKTRIAILHELQHHRQGDTLWIYLLFCMDALFFPNPGYWLWRQGISEAQELACDEVLVDQAKIEPREYARCLIEMAETALLSKERPVCATGLIFQKDGPTLSRRIENMLSGKKKNKMPLFTGLALVLVLASTAFAVGNPVQDRRVSMQEAKAWVANAKQGTDFPIDLNETVLQELNRHLATAQGRDFIRHAYRRMQHHREAFLERFKQDQVPEEILAVPIVESGYRNLQRRAHHGPSAGIWQFIASTANEFGMRVDDQVDERLNVEMETDAAVKYLAANEKQFGDWRLALLAYNWGEKNLQAEIDRTGTRDPWSLSASFGAGDHNYLARFMAALIIVKNPDICKSL